VVGTGAGGVATWAGAAAAAGVGTGVGVGVWAEARPMANVVARAAAAKRNFIGKRFLMDEEGKNGRSL